MVDLRRAVDLGEDVEALKVAAAINPAMSSWVALRRRVPLQPVSQFWSSEPPAMPGRWRSRWPSASGRAGLSAPAVTPNASPGCPRWRR